MTAWYVFATLVGWPLVGFFVLFGDSESGDTDIGDSSADGEGIASVLGSFLSLTALSFFAAFFGLTGLILTWLDANSALTLVWAIALGVFASWFHGAMFRWLVRTSSNSTMADAELEGRSARVTLPIGTDRKGRIAVNVEGRDIHMVALPYRDQAAALNVGDTVVVIEIANNLAMVAPMDDFDI